ncbi:hypothetical protein PO124_31230 [Bacillus licheniformis]|nr:hypothetical protein [Bacillus licheniformis]
MNRFDQKGLIIVAFRLTYWANEAICRSRPRGSNPNLGLIKRQSESKDTCDETPSWRRRQTTGQLCSLNGHTG